MTTHAFVFLDPTKEELETQFMETVLIAFYTSEFERFNLPGLIQIPLVGIEPKYWREFIQAKVNFLTQGCVVVYTFQLRAATRKGILAEYMKWVDQVCDDLPEKTHFNPEEIVYKVIDIMEDFGYKSK